MYWLLFAIRSMIPDPEGRRSPMLNLPAPTTPMLMSRVRLLPQSGRFRSTIPDNSRQFPTLPRQHLALHVIVM
jgi:hypothetical protein